MIARQIPPHSPTPSRAVRFIDDDWNRLWVDADGQVVAYEIHETCIHPNCPFHVKGGDENVGRNN